MSWQMNAIRVGLLVIACSFSLWAQNSPVYPAPDHEDLHQWESWLIRTATVSRGETAVERE